MDSERFTELWYGHGDRGRASFHGLSHHIPMFNQDHFVTPIGYEMRESTYRAAELIFGERAVEDYMLSLCNHIALVKLFAKKHCPDYAWTTLAHDASKFTHEEFAPYVWYWHTDRMTGNYDDWRASYDAAWVHHYTVNPHHWNFWARHERPLPMPKACVMEMLCDWHGAAKAYTHVWDISPWLNKNYLEIELHSDTRHLVRRHLHQLGYRYDSTDGWSLTRKL